MVERFVKGIFAQFNWQALSEDERDVLKGGVKKHVSVLKTTLFFVPLQLALAVLAQDILTVLTVASFIALMLGGAWFAISFQNVSTAQLTAGVADMITKRMFRAFILAFAVLPIGTIVFVVRTMVPEVPMPQIETVPIWLRIVVMIGNVAWLILILHDVYKASVMYDAADSLLGDGFPTLMRGARANTETRSLLARLEEIAQRLGEKK